MAAAADSSRGFVVFSGILKRMAAAVHSRDEEHRRLASMVKHVHAGLRRKYRETGGDFKKIWEEHCQNKTLLTEYADAMHHLAVDHWAQLPETRITWCHDTALEYFKHGGLRKLLEKQTRRTKYQEIARCQSTGETLDAEANENSQKIITTNRSHDTVILPFQGKIRLLDVGSCFNPFLQFHDFLAVGIDISPAKSSVYRCDFLHLETPEPLQVAADTLDTFLSNLKSPIEKLPACSFHVVVFSLLLEYFPSPYQRWLCCQKAHKLLMVNGLLLVITPDSHQQHRNAPMVKSWRKAIESMGFCRWRYAKLAHLHCMAFQKTCHTSDEVSSLGVCVGVGGPELLYIPQDSSEELSSEQNFMHDIFTADNEEFFRNTIHELPTDATDSDNGDDSQ